MTSEGEAVHGRVGISGIQKVRTDFMKPRLQYYIFNIYAGSSSRSYLTALTVRGQETFARVRENSVLGDYAPRWSDETIFGRLKYGDPLIIDIEPRGYIFSFGRKEVITEQLL